MIACNDTYRHKGLRRMMLDALRAGGFADERVLCAMDKVPRHFFFDPALAAIAYTDTAAPIEGGQTISQPSTVAWQTHLLDLADGEKVLEIGTGSGFQAAVLCAMGANVFSIERQKTLHSKAAATLSQMGFHPVLVYGDGFEGLPEQAPFHKIIVTCGASTMPNKLVDQLAVGGKMVIPLANENGKLVMRVLSKLSEDTCSWALHEECAFVPMLQGVA
ncbi:MAG: protein-L-isoaspartate(D-aspartate) O-methyltransferase [Prevotellaceae bacterium]|jgi:protein-L-isoaspartate(D-aspartate) O-methyltransferase|nr:protein-L-isoaspartate(D-aspartate) O-methyltransferase [Prevotellaceae bacterium]